ncbi:MAG: amino acid permease, partial [Proteobacteria bacterium]|nr:amino acid permease [Pseudomonadota bacterium]
VTALYLLINIGFVHALSLPVLAASKLPAADVARQLFPHGGAEFVTIVSLCTVLGLINAILLGAPRIFYAVGRDLSIGAVASVSEGGTPRVALAFTSVAALLLILWGSLEELIALAAVLFVMNYVAGYLALFTLRWREPGLERPFRALGYPWAAAIVLLGSVAFLFAALADDPRSGWFAVRMVLVAAVLGWWLNRRGAAAGN